MKFILKWSEYSTKTEFEISISELALCGAIPENLGVGRFDPCFKIYEQVKMNQDKVKSYDRETLNPLNDVQDLFQNFTGLLKYD